MNHPASRRHFLTTCGLGFAGVIATRDQTSAGQARGIVTSPADLVKDLVAANRILAHEQILDAFGHVSVRHPGNADHFLLARSLAPALVEPADIFEYDLDANPIDPRAGASYRERFIHSEIYRARSAVKAVVHCHTASLIPFGVTGIRLRPLYPQSAFL